MKAEERDNTYFTEGLASLVILNVTEERASQLRAIIDSCGLEFWPLRKGILESANIAFTPGARRIADTEITLPNCNEPDLQVYVEQIASSITSLWAAYSAYLPEERSTLRRITEVTADLINLHAAVKAADGSEDDLLRQKKANSIVSALVELSATLSYAVTQGVSGSAPILCNRSPFPHHSLLGIGGSVRALTRYTRYLEIAFKARSAGRIISDFYPSVKTIPYPSIAKYDSGDQYSFPDPQAKSKEHFDQGGDFTEIELVPLIAHFSLRHGFMESKFSVTAASESLTSETMPQWTLMTLSHEVMHSRVRTIFEALFGRDWHDNSSDVVRTEIIRDFTEWLAKPEGTELPVDQSLRYIILNFCYAIEVFFDETVDETDDSQREVSFSQFIDSYKHRKQLAIEIVVHFHDYYFVYACQPKMYLMSIWASWIKVAAPFSRTLEYLVRSLVTVASGTGLPTRAAFDYSVEALKESLDLLETRGIRSPLFDELRRLVTDSNEVEHTRAYFKPCYYLIDTVRLFFASPTIASNIARITTDPFAEGSTAVEDYSATIYLFPDGRDCPSPIRYSLAALFRSLSADQPPADPQWLTAWNYMVISSKENPV